MSLEVCSHVTYCCAQERDICIRILAIYQQHHDILYLVRSGVTLLIAYYIVIYAVYAVLEVCSSTRSDTVYIASKPQLLQQMKQLSTLQRLTSSLKEDKLSLHY